MVSRCPILPKPVLQRALHVKEKSFRIGSFDIKIHFLSIVSVCALFLSDTGIYPLIIILCAVFHELGHILAMILCGAGIRELYILPFGAQISTKYDMSYKNEIFVAASGPFFSLLLSALLWSFLCFFPCPQLLFGALCSIFLAVINILPIKSFDGGRITRCLFLLFAEYEKALKFIKISELLSLLILSAFCAYTAIFFEFNLSLAGILAYLFIFVYKNDY